MGFDAISGPNWIVPTAPAGDSTNRVANTQFVVSAIASAGGGVSAGATLQTIYNETMSLFVSTATMAGGINTIPVKTDGVQIVSATITPFATANKLLIQSVVPIENAEGNNMIVALFQDAVTAAVVAMQSGTNTSAVGDNKILFSMTAGTTGPTTFKVNVINVHGFNGTWTVNGVAGVAHLGGAMRASLAIQETKV